MGKAKKGKKNQTADDGDSDVETTNIDNVKPTQQSKKKIVESDDSEEEKPKSKAKHKKSVDEDIKEVTKNIKNVSISSKNQKKKVESEDESDEEPEQKPKKKGKKDEKKSAFSLLEIEDGDDSGPEAPPSSDDDKPVQKSQKKPTQEKKEPAGKKGKKAKRKKDDSDDDLEKVLAELEMEYAGVKTEPAAAPAATEVAKEAEVAEEKPKAKKKGKKEEPKEETPKDTEEKEGSDNENDVTIKSAAQKKKEKKEREKQKKLEAKKKEKEQEPKKAVDAKAPEKVESKPEETKEEVKAPSEEKEAEGDVPATEGKKKKKGEKADKDDKGKKGPTKKTIAAMQEALKKVKEEEERMKKEEEERLKQEEERERQRLEAIRLEKERKEIKKQKEKERKLRLKAEGKLLTPKQKAEKARAQALLDSLKAQGIEIGSAEKKPPRPGTRIKPQRLKSQMSQEAPATPVEEKKIELEIVDKKKEDTKPEEKKKESDDESVKDAWDAESSEDEAEKAEPEPVTPVKEEKRASPEDDKSKEKEDDDESSEEDDDSSDEDDDSSEEDSDDDQMTDAQKKREVILKRLEKRREENEANKTNNPLRAAVVCVLGHVDTGKTKILDKLRRTNVQDGEAGGITQQIGATNVPIENIKEQTKHVKGVSEIAFKLPGLLIIDTPGHESFSNLRNRGSSLCDIAILVVDIMHGLEPQTIESINMLKQKKTPFIVALNKIDRLYDWQSAQRKDVRDILKMQQPNTQLEFEKRSKDVMLQFAEQGLNAALFYENPDPRTYVSLVPTSAVTGEGMGNLLAMIVQACEGPLHKRLVFSHQLLATVLEVKAIPGLGTTIDTILINGTLHEGDTMVLAGTDGPIVTQIRSLLMPQPMKELRVKNAYIEHKEVVGAQGVKIAAKELEKAIAGLNLLVAQKPDEVDVLKEEVARELKSALSSIKLTERGVYVQASTLGSLEALLEFLRTSKIPYSAIRIGPVVKRDVMKASAMLEHDSQYATILAFDVKIERDAQELADQLGVKIFAADIIYHLFDKFMAYREELKQRKREEFKHIAVFPCKLKILPQFVFNSRDPIVAGVMVEAGIVKEGTPICVPSKEFVELGVVTSIESNHKQVESARKGQEVCIKIEPIPGESPKMFGRHFDETDFLVSKISRASIDACKDYFRDDLVKTDWQLMVELKKLFQIL
ncbi:eukaryotic translation initiation factor 5B isoform X4 [Ostrinia furnacalis]|uniref:eukaryotic translation initiation factor 5B isoform X1 n=1 Tax=Ostrinia furnacalis TaxID=93504 RepID=UPI00103CC71C|nr:eukaryotic translation initiation factor 5B isoform X1 [Ostrinia furnacalis]XP_028166243.1 eukaryotic translation initiation factor 5B isoform X2 [Ostrinia furnacalis]XP_028166244.1 eukaryotic translation initiation factor 5B isoform X3 [Ostrinia furnacalis]XP_028166245.1 eukaryotic translation initiation factor 5B isoform X4 [Ostrinia furnacalis]